MNSANPIQQWLDATRPIDTRAKALTQSIHDRAWALAATVGIPRHLCCLHNASIDDDMKGWCAGNPRRLRIAKLCSRILSDWSAHRLAEILTAKKWNEIVAPHGFRRHELHEIPEPPAINPALLFQPLSRLT